MRRRRWLRTTGSLVLVGLAGCSSGGGGEDGSETTTEPTPTATPTESTAAHLDAADTEVDAALDALDEESDTLSRATDEQVPVDVARITDRLDAAERELAAAAVSDPNEAQQSTIDALRAMVSSFRDLTTALEAMVAGFDGLRVGLDQFEERELGTAPSTFESAVGSFERAQGAIEDAAADVDGLDGGSTEASVTAYRESLSRLGSLTEAGIRLAEGTRLLSLAFEQFFAAATDYDDGAYAAAVEPFGASRDHADRAATAYGTPSELPADVAGSIARLECIAGNLREGAEHYRLAAEAGANGDTAERRAQAEQAGSALNRDCSPSGSSGAAVLLAAHRAVPR